MLARVKQTDALSASAAKRGMRGRDGRGRSHSRDRRRRSWTLNQGQSGEKTDFKIMILGDNNQQEQWMSKLYGYRHICECFSK